MIVMAGSRLSNSNFHFADWINRHGKSSLGLDTKAFEIPKL
jgi:hypothetical protein